MSARIGSPRAMRPNRRIDTDRFAAGHAEHWAPHSLARQRHSRSARIATILSQQVPAPHLME